MNPTRTSASRWVAALAILAGASAPARAGFTIVDLGPLGKPGTSAATSIDAGGQAAGSMTLQGGDMVAARSSAGGGFGTVAVPPGAGTSVATSINGQGDVAGYYTDDKKVTRGFYTSGGNPAAINPLADPQGATGTFTRANGINAGGQVVGTGDLPSGALRAFSTSGGTPKVINPLGSGGFTLGNGINDGGTVVGTSEIVAGGLQHAFFTGPDGKAVDLLASRNTGGNFHFNTFGTAIANDGDIVGSGDVGSSEHGFFAPGKGGALVDLGTLSGASGSLSYAVNGHALVVGTSGSRAFLWGASEGIFDLNTLISAGDRAHWMLTVAAGINDSNQIAGQGFVDGVLHGFVLTPIAGESLFTAPGTVPEPSTWLLCGVGLAVAAAGSRGRFRPGRTGGPAGVGPASGVPKR